MKTFMNLIVIFLTGLVVILFIADILAAFHSTFFVLTNIHLTRMEAFLAPGNHIGLKLLLLGATYVLFELLTVIANKYK